MSQKRAIHDDWPQARRGSRKNHLLELTRRGNSLRNSQKKRLSDVEPKLRTLKAAGETLAAIRSGEIDAVVIAGRRGQQVVTLRGGEPAFRALVEAMSEGAATLSNDGTLLYSNRRLAKLIHRSSGEIAGVALQSLVGDVEKDKLEALLAAARTGMARGEFNLRSNDGRLIPVQLSLNKIRGYKGRALGMVVTDLTDARRRHADWTRLQLAAVVESSQDAVIGTSLTGRIVSWNRAAEEVFGYTGEEAIGKPISLLIPPGREGEQPVVLRQVQRGKTVMRYETKRMRKDGTVLDVLVAVSPIKTLDGDIIGASGLVRNITARKQAEEIQRAEGLRRLFLDRVLSAQEEERSRIARELHDEAGQLLTSLLVGLRTLDDCKNITEAKAKGRWLREITALAMDEVGRLARGLHPTVLEDHGLAVALRRYIGDYIKVHNVAVNLELTERQSKSLPQTIQLGVYRIIQEALTNISRHARAKTVSIQFTRSATALEVAVADDGLGFNNDAIMAGPVSGLGIQSIKERAALLRGTVKFKSESKGTKITVRIPLTGMPVKTETI